MNEYFLDYGFILHIILIAGFIIYLLDRDKQYLAWTALYAAIVSAAFLSKNFILFSVAVFVLSYFFTGKKPHEKVMYYFLLLPLIPSHLYFEIPGFAGIRYLFVLTYARLIILFILVPTGIQIIMSQDPMRYLSKVVMDKYLLAYVLLICVLEFRGGSATEALRKGFLFFLDVYVPYYVISRSVRTSEQFKFVFKAFLFAVLIACFIGVIEECFNWMAYDKLNYGFRIRRDYFPIMHRMGLLRVASSLGHPIIFGYFLFFGYGIWLYLSGIREKIKTFDIVAVSLIVLALLFTVSRGAWISTFAMFGAFALMSPASVLNLGKWWLSGAKPIYLTILPLLLGGILVSPLGHGLIEMLPSSGGEIKSHADSTVEYRKQVFEFSMEKVEENPMFGSSDYLDSEIMQALMQGEGIVDLVNVYVAVLLDSGFVGFSLFVSVFAGAILSILKLMPFLRKKKEYADILLLGKVLFALLIGTLVGIGTISFILTAPIYTWSLVGLIGAWGLLVKELPFNEEMADNLDYGNSGI